jgi:uncharacterized repeat protein (TIGR03803 family)
MNAQGNRGRVTAIGYSILMVLAAAIAAPAQTFELLASFDGSNGGSPYFGPFVQGSDGSLYGTTTQGGDTCPLPGCGAVITARPHGAVRTLYSFCAQANCPDGDEPYAALTLGNDGRFYGVTYGGGANNEGTVFVITQGDELTTLHSFAFSDGYHPDGCLVQGTDGNLYGTTMMGGANNYGTLFKISASGVFTILHSFKGSDGATPIGGLIQADDDNFYGTASGGTGASSGGTAFKITPAGTFKILHIFRRTDGFTPIAPLLQASDGNFYGSTAAGGLSGAGGTVFKLTPQGTFTILYDFCSEPNCEDGSYSQAALVQGADGNFYGTTFFGGSGTSGTVFSLTPEGALTTLHAFDYSTDGGGPAGGVVQDTNGEFYGTTSSGGIYDAGTIYVIGVGLGPFVKTVPTSAKIGRSVVVLGRNLTSATGVAFNGTPATFTVESPTAIKATVPTGANTGPVQVVTPSGTLTSNVPFRVAP